MNSSEEIFKFNHPINSHNALNWTLSITQTNAGQLIQKKLQLEFE